MDKISGLPDELLLRILSSLSTKEAVSTSVLSKRWQFLWMWLPKLDYGYSLNSKGWRQVTPRDFIDKNLPLHKAPVIESLRLAPSCQDTKPEDINRWVEIAASRYVRELEISFSGYGNISPITASSSLFACKSLVILKLEYATVMDVPSMVCFPSLKSLQLNEVAYANETSLEELLAICPVLEDLDLRLFEKGNMKDFTVSVPSLQKLSLFIHKRLNLDGYEIDTPSLKYFKLVDWDYPERHPLVKDMPKLREADIDIESSNLKNFVGSITSVKHLTICSEYAYGDGFVFNQLEHLKLRVTEKDSSTDLLARCLKDSPNLRVLDISVAKICTESEDYYYDTERWKQPSDVPECLLSSLQIFNWSGYFGRPRDRDIAVYILKNARHLKKANLG